MTIRDVIAEEVARNQRPTTKLPDEPTRIVLFEDTWFDGDELQRFYDAGGEVDAQSLYRVVVIGDLTIRNAAYPFNASRLVVSGSLTLRTT